MKKMFMIVMVALLGISFMGISSAIAGGECPTGPGTGTPGYWKNHPEAWEGIIDLCGTPYDENAILHILNSPVKGNKWITLFKAYAAAKLNVKAGNCMPMCDTSFGRVDLGTVKTWLCTNQGLRVKANSNEWQYSHGEAQYWCLDDYNNGLFPEIAVSRDSLE